MSTKRTPLSRGQQFLNRRPSLIVSLGLLVLATIPLSLGLGRAQSAPAVLKNPRLLAPVPRVKLVDVPSEVLIGEDFTFIVAFDNQTLGSTVGFGPFIDLVLDSGGADHNNSGGPCDGIQLVSAEMVDVSGGPINLTPPPNTAPCNTSPTALTHALGPAPFGPVMVPAGGELRTIVIPFGSYQPTEPTIKIKVTAHVHSFADAGYPLAIYARGGFRLGAAAQNSPPILSDASNTAVSWVEQDSVVPVVLKAGKGYRGPEDETATGPNFPQDYGISVDVAGGTPPQTLTNLVVKDCLPGSMQFVGVGLTTPNPSSISMPTSGSPCLQLTYASVTGAQGPDVQAGFTFFVGQFDGTRPVLPRGCRNTETVNTVQVTADWTPTDPRDGPGPQQVASSANTALNAISNKRLAIQKTVETHPTPNAPIVPGSFLKYTLKFQVSDFFTVGRIEVEDILSDGQGFINLGSLAPKLTVSDRTGPTPTVLPFTPGTHGPSLQTQLDNTLKCGAAKGGRRVTFRVSTAMRNGAALFTSSTLQSGILTGGHALSPPANVPATGEIVFYARVLDAFVFPQTPGDKFLDKHDPLHNCVTISAELIHLDQLTGVRCPDDSETDVQLDDDVLEKTVYARNGSTSDPELSNSPPRFAAGDTVTFRLRKTIPSGDYESLTITDWPPLPVVSVVGMTPGTVPTCTAPPVSGVVCRFMPGHTLPATPTLAVSAPDNSFTLSYGTGNNPGNQPKTIDLLVSLTVSADPYADHLFLANKAQECEQNTFGETFCQRAFAHFELTEPHVRIRKGVVATNNPNGFFAPTPPGPGPVGVTFTAQTTSTGSLGAPVWTPPTIDSTDVVNPNVFNSDLYNADAGDWVTFAILLENRGSGLNGAFDVKVKDTPDPGFTQPPATYVMPAHDGTGAGFGLLPPLTFALMTPVGEELVDPGPTAVDAGSLDRYSPTTGRNLAVLTYNMQLKTADKITIGECLGNTAELVRYSSSEGGPNFVGAVHTTQLTDRAKVCINPTLEKTVVATSEAHTTPETSAVSTSPPQVAVGEVVRYRLVVRLPEGSGPNFALTDALPSGMKFMNDNTARAAFVSTGGTAITHPSLTAPAFNVSGNQATLAALTLTAAQNLPPAAISVGPNCGDAPTFSLGNVQNSDNDPDLEFVVVEFNALVCNLPANQQPPGLTGTQLPNTFSVSVDGDEVATSNSVSVVVVEPHLAITKTAAPAAGGTANFTITLSNTSAATAFDVQMTDALSPGLTFASAPTTSVAPANCAQPAASVSGNTVTVNIPKLAAAPGCTVTLTFTANVPGTCPPPSPNTVLVSYTSLPGGGTPAGSPGNNTGSGTPGPTGAPVGERPYNTSAWAAVPNNCPPACVPRPPNMISWWPLNEQTGATVVADIAGPHNGTPLPNGAVGPPNGPPPVPGMVGTALWFGYGPSASIYYNVNVPDHPSLRFGTVNLTIDAWFKSSRNPPVVVGIVDKLDIAAKKGYAFYIENSRLTLVMGDGSSFVTYTSNVVAFPVHTWHHIAVTVDRVGVGTFYFDGAPAGNFTPLAPGIDISSNSALLIGGSRFTFTLPDCICEYALDEIEIFSGVVPGISIEDIFEAGSAGKCP